MNEAMVAAVSHDRVLDSYRRAQRAAEDLVAGVRPEQFGDPTPCSEWTVRDLLDHLVYVDVLYTAHLDRREPPEPGARIGTEPLAVFRDAGRRAAAVFSREGVLADIYPSPFGDIPGSVIVQHVVNELLVHSWDLATATAQHTDIEPDLAEESLSVWQAWTGGMPRGGEGFGPEQPVAGDATAADRLAAYLGRKVTA